MTQEEKMLPSQEDALALIQSSRLIASARKAENAEELAEALEKNVRLWTAIQTLMTNKNQTLPTEIKDSLCRLARFVVEKTYESDGDLSEKTLDTLENINMQIAEGLLENIAPSALKENALALLETVSLLTDAKEQKNLPLLTDALEHNIRVWTALLTLLESGNSDIPAEATDNLKRLGLFIIRKSMEAGESEDADAVDMLTRLNMQIAEGFLENRTLTATQEDALALLQSALRLSEAKEANDLAALTSALDENLKLWTAIRTLMQQENHPMAGDIKTNLIRLADYTAHKTFEIGADPQNTALNTLINLNLQISEGLLERTNAA